MVYFCEIHQRDQEPGGKKKCEMAAARKLLLRGLNREYAMTELPVIDREPGGKPFFPEYPEIFFNYSHCRRGILCGISDCPVGVDVETVRNFSMPVIKRICHPAEWAIIAGETLEKRNEQLTMIWTAKEAYLKYTGEGIRRDLSSLNFSCILTHGIAAVGKCYIQTMREEAFIISICSDKIYSDKIICCNIM